MDQYQRTLRLGAALIACALVIRLTEGGIFRTVGEFLTQPNIASAWIYLETGRFVRFSDSPEEQPLFALESRVPDFAREETERPVFTPEDAQGISVRYNCTVRPDLEALLTQPLEWDLRGEEPTVLILHTHTTESYTPTPEDRYTESGLFRTLDEKHNMLSVGDRLAELLEAGGIRVLHDRELHDYPSYNGSYNHARKSIQSYLVQYPSIRLVLDLHRDAAGESYNQMQTHATVDGRASSQLMLVIGTDSTGRSNRNWEANLALGLKLQVQMERIHPGVMRYVNLRSQRFNQDLLPGTLLVEVGAAGDSREKAIAAVEALAQGILALADGCEIGAEAKK